jgi:hypothetical protein
MSDSLLAAALAARRQSGKGLLRQLAEACALRLGSTRLGPTEYYFYRLFDTRLSRRERNQFAGFRLERRLDDVLNSRTWWALANDKLLFYQALDGLGIDYPPVRAAYVPVRRRSRSLVLSSADEIASFLRSPASYPMFIKPLQGSYGRGACSAVGYDAARDTIRLGNGESWQLTEAVRDVMEPRCRGYLFQQLVETHETLRERSGPTLSSARVVVLLNGGAAKLLRCTWKVPTGRNMVDNFIHGKSGNLLAHVEPEDGEVQRVVRGVGLAQQEVLTHPDTGRPLTGFRLPDWRKVRDLCLDGASAFPGLRLQHWDVALGQGGPKALEMNVQGSLDLHQLSSSEGVFDDELRQCVHDAERNGTGRRR